MQQRALIPILAAVLALLPVVPGTGQSAFPIRFDTPPSVATPLSQGAFTIRTGTDYQTRGALTVTPFSSENLFRITATEDDTTVWAQVFVTAVQSDTTSPSSLYEKYLFAIYDSTAGTWASLQSGHLLNAVGGGQITVDYTLSGSQITVSLKTPTNLDQATYRIQVTTNKSVTFTPLI